MDNCQVVFYGEILPGQELKVVQQKVAALFKLSAAQAEVFFSGKRVVIKSGLPQAKALQYQKALQKAGAKASIESPEEQETKPAPSVQEKAVSGSESSPAAEPVSKPIPEVKTQTASEVKEMAPVSGPGDRLKAHDDYGVSMTSQVDEKKLGGLQQATVAPVGTAISSHEQVPELNLDLSHLSFSEPGATLTDPEEEVVHKPIDISHLSIDS